MKWPAYLFFGGILLVMPIAVAYMFFLLRLISKLAKDHPATYRELGEPAFFTNNTPKNGRRLAGFILRQNIENSQTPA